MMGSRIFRLLFASPLELSATGWCDQGPCRGIESRLSSHSVREDHDEHFWASLHVSCIKRRLVFWDVLILTKNLKLH